MVSQSVTLRYAVSLFHL